MNLFCIIIYSLRSATEISNYSNYSLEHHLLPLPSLGWHTFGRSQTKKIRAAAIFQEKNKKPTHTATHKHTSFFSARETSHTNAIFELLKCLYRQTSASHGFRKRTVLTTHLNWWQGCECLATDLSRKIKCFSGPSGVWWSRGREPGRRVQPGL